MPEDNRHHPLVPDHDPAAVTEQSATTMPRTRITPDGPDRRLDALRKANKIRSRRAKLKKDLAGGSVQIVDILALPPDFAETERVSVLLRAVPKYGSARVTRLLTRARIGDSKRLAGLSDRERAELINHFQ